MGDVLYFDTHTHYDDKKYSQDRTEVLQSLKAAGVDRIVNCACDLDSCQDTLRLMKTYDFVYGAMGVHPHSVKDLDVESVSEIYRDCCGSEKVVAVGEIGLDYHYDLSPRDVQREWFIEQIELAKELELPIVVHSREAAMDTFRIIKESDAGALGGIIHSYTGGPELAREYIRMGFYIGIGGMVTFPNVKKVLQTVKEIDIHRIVLETDCPYLAPVPHRGQRNDSRNLPYIAGAIAEIKGMTAEDVANLTYANAVKVFQIEREAE